jgi:hypothetical protein
VKKIPKTGGQKGVAATTGEIQIVVITTEVLATIEVTAAVVAVIEANVITVAKMDICLAIATNRRKSAVLEAAEVAESATTATLRVISAGTVQNRRRRDRVRVELASIADRTRI